eukprot:14491866-Alexandrium_andersonii.AAC.1
MNAARASVCVRARAQQACTQAWLSRFPEISANEANACARACLSAPLQTRADACSAPPARGGSS